MTEISNIKAMLKTYRKLRAMPNPQEHLRSLQSEEGIFNRKYFQLLKALNKQASDIFKLNEEISKRDRNYSFLFLLYLIAFALSHL